MTKQKLANGRPLKKITQEQLVQVETLAAYLSIADIANYFGFSEETFYEIKNRQPEVRESYNKGKSMVISRVASKLLEAADSGNVSAMMFYLKTRGGWSEKLDVTTNNVNLPKIIVEFSAPYKRIEEEIDIEPIKEIERIY